MREIGSGELLQLLQETFPDVPGETITARYKYFQRNGFPEHVGPKGPGYRRGYDQSSIWQLVLAFELLRNWMSPADAMLVIETLWTELARAVGVTYGIYDDDPDGGIDTTVWIGPTALQRSASEGSEATAQSPPDDEAHEADAEKARDTRPKLHFEIFRPLSDFEDAGIRSGIGIDLMRLISEVYETSLLRPFLGSRALEAEMSHWAKGKGTRPY